LRLQNPPPLLSRQNFKCGVNVIPGYAFVQVEKLTFFHFFIKKIFSGKTAKTYLSQKNEKSIFSTKKDIFLQEWLYFAG
jgi:hypothetical protein